MRRFEPRLTLSVLLGVTLACLHTPEPVEPGPDLVELQLTPVGLSLARGTTGRLTATGVYSDQTSRNVSPEAKWSSTDPAVVAVDARGGVRAVAPGSAVVVAALAGVTGVTRVTVTAAQLTALAVDPPAPALPRGITARLSATGLFTDGSAQDLTEQATWTSSSPGVATVSSTEGSRGLVVAVAVGAAEVSATFGGMTGKATVTVTAAALASIDLTPAAPALPKGTTRQLAATGVFTDGSTQDITELAEWTSSRPGVATVTSDDVSRGLLRAVAPGRVDVRAAIGNIRGTARVTVTDAALVSLAVAPSTVTLPLGLTEKLRAVGTFSDASTADVTSQATWTSSDPATAQVCNDVDCVGLLATVAPGTATVTAAIGRVSATARATVTTVQLASLRVTPDVLALPVGLTRQLEATATYTDGTSRVVTAQASWTSSAPSVASVSTAAGSAGRAAAVAVGTAAVTARFGGQRATASIEVTPAVIVALAVTPAAPSVAKGLDQQLTAMGTWSDATTTDVTGAVTWMSSDPATASVSNAAGAKGLATGLQEGVATITAAAGTVSASAALTVTPELLLAVTVSPLTPSVPLGLTLQLTATGRYTDASTRNLTALAAWSSSDETVARVSTWTIPQGEVTTVAEGTATVTATFGGFSGSTVVTVAPPRLVSLAVIPAAPSVTEGLQVLFVAMGTYTDASQRDVTAAVQWTSSATSVATIDAAGVATAVLAGTTTVTARSGTLTATASLTVVAPVLVSIAVALSSGYYVPLGLVATMTATGTYDNGASRDVTALATWTSANTAIAAPATGTGQQGRFTTHGTGIVAVTADIGTVSGTTNLTVGPPDLVTFTVTPATATVAIGGTQQFTATGVFTDGSSQNLTLEVEWVSLTPAVASVSNEETTVGIATGLAAGTSVIRAQYQQTFASGTLTVSP